MKKRKLLFTMLALSLGCLSGGSGAMAQNGWENAYAQTQTTSDDWTPITEGTTQGKILGAAQSGSSATYYYYVTKSLNFTNNRTDDDGNGNSGLKIHGTVYLYIPTGLTITCEGANADGRTGAGAGIELASGNTLYIIGGGTVNAIGGRAENGRDGGKGTDAYGNSSWLQTGTGGSGGNGGGGAGAGIGTRGGTGGTGGSGGYSYTHDFSTHNGTDGSDGTGGGSAGAMGNLYVANGITVNATGGNAGSSGTGGGRGKGYIWDGGNNYTLAGGGGGGAGGFGGAAANIGTGGPGGGGGGGGAGGAQDWRGSQLCDVTAYGGNGGTNGDGTSAANGAEANTTRSAYENGLVVSENSSYTWKWDDWNPASGDASFGYGGSGGGTGSASSGGTQHEGSLTYNVTYTPIKTKLNGTDLTSRVVTYNAGVGSVILPENADGYQWVLRVYGKSCAPNGTSASQFATPTKNYFGGYGTSDLERTVVLANVYGDIEFQEIATFCKLENDGNNSQLLLEYSDDGYPVTVRLKDRTLYKDGDWNTLCLPFDMTAAQIANSPLAGALIYKMDETITKYYPNGYDSYNYPVLYFHFVSATSSSPVIQAGKPYLVKWTSPDGFTDDGHLVDNTWDSNNRHDLDFSNVTVKAIYADNWSGNNITFQGTLGLSSTLTKGDKTKLVLGKNNKLYYPGANLTIGACRGYFVISQSVADLLPDNPSNAPQIMMDFGDGEATGIQTFNVTPESQNDTPVYNLNGQRLNAPQKGINIVNGKKVLVK